MKKIKLQHYSSRLHLSLVESWLKQAHIARWWSNSQQALDELRQHTPEDQAMIVLNDRPVGYICWQIPTPKELHDAGLQDLPPGLVDIDIMIGEASAMGQGIGPDALLQLFKHLRSQHIKVAGLAAALANERALKAYTKVGFHPFRDFMENGEAYRYFILPLENK